MVQQNFQPQLVIDSIPAMAWSARADGTGEFFNRRYLDYVGLQLDQVRDWQWIDLIHPDDVAVVLAAWDQVRLAPGACEVEARMRRHDGVYRRFSFRSKPVRDAHGNVIKWYGVNIDIEEQKRAAILLDGERRLLDSIACCSPLREVLTTLCEVAEQTLSDCFCEVRVADLSGLVFEHTIASSLPQDSSAASAVPVKTDFSPAGMAAAANAEIIAEDLQADPRWQQIPLPAQLMRHGLNCAWSTPFSSHSGTLLGTLSLYYRTSTAMQSDHRDIIGRLTRIASIAIERSRARDELRRKESLLESAERLSETGSYYWDVINNKLMWSRQEYRNWEIDPSLEPMSLNLLPQVHPDDRPMVEERIRRIFRGEDIPEVEERHIMPDGRVKYMRGSTRVFRYEDGRIECVGVAQDVTRRRLTEQALDKVRSELAHVTRVASLGELAASIAHEVNQPLAGIISNASACLRMLASDPSDAERAVKAVERIIRDGNRASEVTKRLRNLFRRQDFSAEPFNLNEAVQEVIAICSHDLQRRRITLDAELDRTLQAAVGDRIQLQQVILNLVLNAADAIDTSGHQVRRIALKTTQPAAGLVQLTVADTGCGIAPVDLNKIFEAFYTTKPNGMGIGLSVSRSILERHGGKLWASLNDGPGSAVSFSVPCTAANLAETIA